MSFYRLIARDDTRNIKREYIIFKSESLFGDSLVNIFYGREKSRGHHLTIQFKDETEADNYIKKSLNKRLTSKKRIGCNYKFIN
jgi:hypothetical protein